MCTLSLNKIWRFQVSVIISIGNISLGGTGKTPFAIKISEYFLKQGKTVCVLSRGYKGKAGYETHVISDGKHILMQPPEAADEPYMIAKSLAGVIVITGKERNKSYDYAVEHFNPDIFILDDGFQHKRMKRDIDIVLLAHKRPASTGFPFPFGYLREFPSGIQRADMVVFTRALEKRIPKEVTFFVKDKPIYYSNTRAVVLCRGNEQFDMDDFHHQYAFAFAGIAKNMNFFNSLLENGINIRGTQKYMDHHSYSEKDIARIETLAERKKSDLIITTEKDYVKLPEEFQKKVYYLKIDIIISNEDGFFKDIERLIQVKGLK